MNLRARKSYLQDVDPPPPETLLTPPNSKSWKIHWLWRWKVLPKMTDQSISHMACRFDI